MKRIKALHDQRKELADAMTAITTSCDREGRVPSDAEFTRFNSLKGMIEKIDQQIVMTREVMEEEQANLAARIANPNDPGIQGSRDDPIHGPHAWRGRGSGSNGGFGCFAEFLASLGAQARNQAVDARLAGLRVNAAAMGGSSGETGGYAVPTAFSTGLLAPEPGGAALIDLVTMVPFQGDKLRMPAFADANHQTSSPYGLTWRAIAEGTQIAETEPSMRQVEFHVTKHGGLSYISNEMLNDSTPAVQSALEVIFRDSLRGYLEKLIIRGNGVGEPMGLLNAPCAIEADKVALQASDTVILENILEMWGRLLPASQSRAVWLVHQSVVAQLASMSVTLGTSGSVVGILGPNATSPLNLGLFGRPIIVSEYCSVLGDVGDIIAIDPSKYILAVREPITIDASPHLRFAFDQLAYRILARVDGKPTLDAAMQPYLGDTVSSIVTLEAR